MRQLIGREQELSALGAFLDDAQREPVALVLEGEAGIGKTHLWRETVTIAERLGFAVLAARAAGPEVELSYAALADLIVTVPEEVLVALPSPQRHALEVALLLVEPGNEPPDERAVAAALFATLRAVASGQPVLVAVDDMQWLDSATARALRFALRRVRAERIAAVLTLRVGDGAADDPRGLLQALAERALRRIELRGLTVGALHEILRTSLGSSLSRRTLLRVHDATGGNPFFALELARTLQHHGGEPAAHEPLPVPEKLHELVAARLAALTPSVQETLLLAASAARPTVELLRTATGNGSQLVRQVEEAEAADVIRVDRTVIRFTHPLLRSMHISRASRAERRRAHGLLAAVVAEPEERARHLALATAEPDEAVAAELEEAAASVRARGAPAGAAALLEESYRLTPAAEKDAAARRATDAAEAAFEIGDLDRSKQLIEDVWALDPEREPLVLAMLARVALQTSNANAVELYDRAAASAGDPALEADIRISLSNAQYIGGDDLTAAAANARRAIEIADELRDDRLLVRALGAAAAAEALFGGPRAQAILRRGLAVEKRTPNWTRRPNHGFLEARSYGDDQADVRAYAAELYDQAIAGVEGDVVPAMWGPLYNGAWSDMLLGRWPEAKASTDAAITAALESRSEHAHAGFLALRALLEAHRGETVSAVKLLVRR